MAAFEITGGIDPLLAVTLEKGEAILAESNAMVAMDTALSLKGKTRGGLMGSIARKFMNDETFFQQRIEADDQAGTVLLAPNLPGDVRILDVGPAQYLLSDGAFLACTEGVELSTKSQGIGRALLGDSGGFFVMGTEGSGRIAVSGFGSIRELDVTRAPDHGRQRPPRRLERTPELRPEHQHGQERLPRQARQQPDDRRRRRAQVPRHGQGPRLLAQQGRLPRLDPRQHARAEGRRKLTQPRHPT